MNDDCLLESISSVDIYLQDFCRFCAFPNPFSMLMKFSMFVNLLCILLFHTTTPPCYRNRKSNFFISRPCFFTVYTVSKCRLLSLLLRTAYHIVFLPSKFMNLSSFTFVSLLCLKTSHNLNIEYV